MPAPSKEITQLLVDWGQGDQQALNRLMPIVYDELHRLAGRYLRRERPDHTLQSTALVHEAYMKLVDQKRVSWKNRTQFFGVAAQLIRRILVDHARRHGAAKRGPAYKLSLDDAIAEAEQPNTDLVALDDALTRLANIDPQQSRIVELRFFGGLSIDETAEALGISPSTVKRDWNMARAWLYREIAEKI